MVQEAKAIKATYISIISNTALALIKWLTGYFGNSYALIADAIESTADIFSSIMVMFGLRYASRPADSNHPYGHGRIEPLVTILVVVFLIGSALFIAIESIKNISVPHELPELYTLFVLGGIIVWKEISFRVVMKKSKETNSSSLKADAWHHRSDAITSVTAFVGVSIALIFGKGYESADDWAALCAAAFIIYNSFTIFRPAWGELMDEHLYADLEAQIRQVSITAAGVMGTEKCHIRKTGMKYLVDLHVLVNAEISVKVGHEIAHELKDRLKAEIPEIANVLIHIEPHQS